ncbi:hypothetical protein, partial [Nocardia seriolae]
MLYPFKAAAKNYGEFTSTSEFFDTIVRDDYFTMVILTSDHVAAIRDLLGPLVLQRHLCESVLVDLLCGVGSCCGRVGFVDESDRGSVRADG